MQRVAAFLLLFLVAANSAFAGVDSKKARYLGGTTTEIPLRAVGLLVATDEARLSFDYEKGPAVDRATTYPPGQFTIPYPSITSFASGQRANMRVWQTVALTALAGAPGLLLLFSKSHSHFLTLKYKDAEEKEQSIVFEVGKDAIRPMVASLEARTGKKAEVDATDAMKKPAKVKQPPPVKAAAGG